MMTIADVCEELCKKGVCSSDCCGVVPISAPVLYRNRNLYQTTIIKQIPTSEGIFPVTEDGHCVFLNRKRHRCMIYLSRPEVCRIYGKVKELQCPYIKMNGKLRNKDEQEVMKIKIKMDVDETFKKIERCVKR